MQTDRKSGMPGRVFLPWALGHWHSLQNRPTYITVYHTSRDSVSVVTTTFKVYGKKQTLTLSQPKTPESMVTKFERRDYVVHYLFVGLWVQHLA